MTWYELLAGYLPPILMILGYMIRMESRLSRIEGELRMLRIIVCKLESGGDTNGKEEDCNVLQPSDRAAIQGGSHA
ncbi:MAG: hypothetical protein QXQ53_03815 [Candidatus Methanosuratincola sp.]